MTNGIAGGDAPLDLVGGEAIAAAVVLECVAARLGGFALLVELRRRAEAAKSLALAQETPRVALMAREIRALVRDVFVPLQAEPLEALEDGARARVGAAALVGVLDAQEELAAVLLDVEPVEERGARAADVEEAGRRRGEAEAVESIAKRPANGKGGIRTLDTAFDRITV